MVILLFAQGGAILLPAKAFDANTAQYISIHKIQ